MHKYLFLFSLFLFQEIQSNQSLSPLVSRYDQKYYNIAHRANQPIGIVIIAYNRPDYLKQLITCLEKNPEAQTLPFYFILDGGPKAKQQENSAIINKSSLKYKEIILRERNYGCAKNQIDALRFMFDWCQFSRLIVLEEDLIVTPSYIKLTLALQSWAQKNYSNVGVTQSYSYCKLNRKQKKRFLSFVQANSIYWSFVTYCLDKVVWDNIKQTLYEYEALFIDTISQSDDFARERSKPGFIYAEQIRSWARNLIAAQPRIKHLGKIFSDVYATKFKREFLSQNFCGNQDCIIALALWLAGYVKIQTVVNRAKHIGEVGISFGPNIHNEWGQEAVTLDYFKEDKTLTAFQEKKAKK